MITVEHLTKRYGSFTAVDDVSFVVRPGTVTGFLGPNGAGKTTVLKAICGLTDLTSGRATVLGRPYRDLGNPGREVGVLLDASAQHAGRTGREVLLLGALVLGVDRDRVDQLLELVGLTPDEARRRVRHYSLGMRQRLGVAHALLGEPKVLLLDEPANGLDPQGIHWMRSLLRGFADTGGTVLLSSHLLHEVEVVADELILIGRGRVVASGSKAELLGTAGTHARTPDPRALVAALHSLGYAASATADGLVTTDATPEQVSRTALEAGLLVTELGAGPSAGLEDLFLGLTAADSREGALA